MIDINTVTYEDLKAGKYEKDLPELYELKNVVEHNTPFHNRQVVFDHILDVFKSMKDLLKLDFIAEKEVRNRIDSRLDKSVGNSTRRELLLQSALLHDIAKDITVKKLPDGRLVCPKHDEAGVEAIKGFKKRFGWLEKDMKFVESLVRRHLTLADLVDAAWKEPNHKTEVIRQIKDFTGDSCLEEALFQLADAMGLDLKTFDPEYLNAREKICKELILNEAKI